jgi:hypothetical protein
LAVGHTLIQAAIFASARSDVVELFREFESLGKVGDGSFIPTSFDVESCTIVQFLGEKE